MDGVTKIAYRTLVRRQDALEAELGALKRIVAHELEEGFIRPRVFERWERISRDIDSGKGRSFSSVKQMRQWLKNA